MVSLGGDAEVFKPTEIDQRLLFIVLILHDIGCGDVLGEGKIKMKFVQTWRDSREERFPLLTPLIEASSYHVFTGHRL